MLYQLNRPLNAATLSALPLAVVLLSGCMSSPGSVEPEPVTEPAHIARPLSNAKAFVHAELSSAIRYGRYTLANTSPRAEQIDLLTQVIDIQIPDGLAPTVRDALAYVVRHSGYQLCPTNDDVQSLYMHPLPASHYRLGPISLRNALVTLAGVAWQPVIDEKTRTICFETRSPYELAWNVGSVSKTTDSKTRTGGE
ncbi:type IV pili sensor histidine kinase/response regulator [Pseudomonas lurida]|uniref:PFGI-1 class ICE element type IV pilus protein PilL2 n=1 Tax=Pseudomonas lurida TaxID=244566 RepID=UPI000BF581B0|nr:PilL N-terminal domain-containing protein [Pseudomonas lurida]PFG25094.1 type IV pili sensor histidine kinase/response regulator [Pseudomonas lurida]